jgi:hypothetical protein
MTDIERKQKVLVTKVKIEGDEKYAILDTGSNLSRIDVSLIKDKKIIKLKEKVIITEADGTELILLEKIELTIKINNKQYIINAYVIKGLITNYS